ncbi:4Fe-4S binding protein [Acetobacterium wieringae]|uniref:4Fe-4S binding protein n=1 Tax=Acetobacterium wieringae TaxID=52694 RepID=A0A1F2PEW0_9FIRM|nr:MULTISPECIES: 4Fe-4S binding protein [Acetobacterium]MEA4806410.1 4Fe-4S binding protein [Acetobacterium wieringae]OFV69808.1 pyruvate synthase subunit PorD [Acetobacterium wieringae]OXS24664.1 MAG: pyruvate ferredoxin oxidoreductase [Acetobacterium sp. MES1]UYO61529.1 4Fe-4S binding protein [Acetobacterium wieringae]VUZ28412.1 Uncharacterised protein [Acetobacterium wieringae]
MSKPYLRHYQKPQKLSDYPLGTASEAGYLVTKNCGWRNERPIIVTSECINCLQCYLYCPDGVIFKTADGLDIDYDFCKGCGICEKVCPKQAIKMEVETND